ncbi:hypothetical protein [Gemella cuniculi]|uniref:hypothetical protein n=1 Tax=Gemella cuniculi TaxID=150240 RepID=UPI0004075486|nr:hypothetical protein [Gemella cuniculi]
MYDFKYTLNDIDFYLEAHKKIKRQLEIYLINKLDNNNDNLISNNNSNEYDNNLISKFSDYDYEKDRNVLNLLDSYKNHLKETNELKYKIVELR